MKRKHLSLLIISISFTAVLLVLWYEFQYLTTPNYQSNIGKIQPLSEIKVPDKAVLEKMDRLERHIHLLSTPQPSIHRKADLSAMGYIPVSRDIGGGSGDTASNDSAFDHRVTMAFEGEVKRFCIIDSSLYPEGAMLPDGATILKIESTRVLIAKESLRQWLSVDPLFEATTPDKS